MSEPLEAWRERYRAEEIPASYRGKLHLALTTTITVGGAFFAFWQARGATPIEWLTVPVSFLVANSAEYVGHRWPMHHRYRGLERVFHRHAATHHRFFSATDMLGRDARDWHVTLFAPVLLLFFFGAIGLPIAGLLFWALGWDVGWLFVATALSYFAVYEWLHLSYHVAPDSLLHRLPGLAALSRHHRAHHDPRRMAHCNFNISFPLVDILVGTRQKS